MDTLLRKTRKINNLIQKQALMNKENDLPYDKIAIILGDVIDANSFIISNDGVLLGFHERKKYAVDRLEEMIQERQFPEAYTNELSILKETAANVPINDEMSIFPVELRAQYPDGWTTISPIFAAGHRFGSIILGREEKEFTDEDLVLIEYSSTVVGMQILYQESRVMEEEIREKTALNIAVQTLSHSEIRAVRAILGELDGDEGRLTASEIADAHQITRSVIVNALSKLSSAGIITSRSLGMKGTWVKVLNKGIFDEIKKGYL